MRTIPVSKSIHPHHHVSTFDEVKTLLHQAEEPFVIIECICRKKKAMKGNACKVTNRKETCLAMGNIGQMVLLNGIGKKITLDKAMSILDQNQKQGLILQPSNTEKADFICSCCGCCCGMLGVHKMIPKPLDYWASNFYAAVDPVTCEGCGACENSCQVGAVAVNEKKHHAVIDLDLCLGCGICATNCPSESIALVKKHTQMRPPQTREDLYEIIMAKKKGRLAKMKLTGKLFVDAIKTGQTTLLKL
jgi:NAD-dependent dihydropyrimidine dehydrogenase PreA subunit